MKERAKYLGNKMIGNGIFGIIGGSYAYYFDISKNFGIFFIIFSFLILFIGISIKLRIDSKTNTETNEIDNRNFYRQEFLMLLFVLSGAFISEYMPTEFLQRFALIFFIITYLSWLFYHLQKINKHLE